MWYGTLFTFSLGAALSGVCRIAYFGRRGRGVFLNPSFYPAGEAILPEDRTDRQVGNIESAILASEADRLA